MGDIVDLSEYRKISNMDEDYEKFVNIANKTIGIPTTFTDIAKAFYLGLRYLDGTLNCFEILSMVKGFDQKQVDELKAFVGDWLEYINTEMQKY